MFDRIKAKENAKTLLRGRTLLDVLGFSLILGSLIFIAPISIFLLSLPMIAAMLLFHAGMNRSALRTHRGDKNVRVVDIILAGDRLGKYIAITLWQALFQFLWNLPSAGVILIAAILVAKNPFNTVAIAFGVILVLLAFAWSIYITILKSCQYYFAYCITEDQRELAALDCIRESKALMDGHEWELFVTHLSFLGWDILSSLIIVNLFTLPYKYLTYTAIYEQLNNRFKPISRNQMEWSHNKPVTGGGEQKSKEPAVEFIAGEYAGSGFPLQTGDEICIGRDPKRANVVTSPANTAVSGLHCRIRYEESQNKYVVTDHSANGTWLNNEKLTAERSVYAAHGSVIKIADGTIVLRLA